MSDNCPADTKPTNSENPKPNSIASFFHSPLFMMILIAALVVYVFKDLERFGYILIVLMGFGGVVFIHEFGHFMAAKSVGILVESFAIGMGPILVGIKRMQSGIRLRFLPKMGADENSPEGRGLATVTIPTRQARPGDTEYQIRLLPIGGFVKMLGQEDMGTVEQNADPRSFMNKGFWQRVWVISAGVLMNVISGGLLFIAVFAHGVSLSPAVVGSVMQDSPAEKAGLKPGDKIVAINGEQKELFTFTELMMAAAFAGKDQPVALTVERAGDGRHDFSIVPVKNQNLGIQVLGVSQSESLTIARPHEAEALTELDNNGLLPGDKIVAVDGRQIERADQLYQSLWPEPGTVDPTQINLAIQRTQEGRTTLQSIPVNLTLTGLRNPPAILGLVPRLKISAVLPNSPAEKAGLQPGDVIVQAATVFCPEQDEFRDIVQNHGNKPLPLKIQRGAGSNARVIDVSLAPQYQQPSLKQRLLGAQARPLIGIMYAADACDLPVVGSSLKPTAATESDSTPAAPTLDLPRGARITTVAGQPVNNYRDIIRLLSEQSGKETTLAWIPFGEQTEQKTTITVPQGNDWIGLALRPDLGQLAALPLKPLEMTFKGNSISENLELGMRTSWTFIAQTYVMIKGMITGTIGVKAASGPVGILKMSYTIASERPLIYYLYFMATISMAIAVFNFLPLPIVDGGLIVILIIEKLKGSPLTVKTQEIINYAGLALLGSFALLVTYQDIYKIFTGQM